MSVVAIDGPAGAGKTTIARAVAEALGWDYVDTGAMYRAIALRALDAGIDPTDEERVAEVASGAHIVSAGRTLTLDGVDVSTRIREDVVTRTVPQVAANARVRTILVEHQREAARTRDVVMEGRDIGTVVFPDADVKIYLDASPEERARRRASDPAHRPAASTALADVATALAERDKSDSTRAVSPLAMAADAVLIETTAVPIESVVDRVMAIVEEKRRRV